MAFYKKQKQISEKSDAAKYLVSDATKYLVKVAGAEHKIHKYEKKGKTVTIKKSGIQVTGKLKEFARESAYNRTLLSALRTTAESEMKLAEERLEKLDQLYQKEDDVATAKLLHDYITKYISHLQSLNRAAKGNRSAIQLVNRLEDLANYNESSYRVVRNPSKYFSEYRAGVICAVMNNLYGANRINMTKEDLMAMLNLSVELGLFEYNTQMNEAYEKWEASNAGSDQFSIILQNLSKAVKALMDGDAIKNATKDKQDKINEFMEIAQRYNLW